MADFTIPCETFARLAGVLHNFHADADEWFNAVRVDHGIALASNRHIMVAENIGGPGGVVHIIADPALIEQCRKEAPFNSVMTITVNEPLKFAVAKTTLGYVHPGNCAVWSDKLNVFDQWRDIMTKVKEPAKATKGAMFWDADDIARLAAASPSGRLVFEEVIDASGRPTLVRDINDSNWCALFNPFADNQEYQPATLPRWIGA